MVTVRTGGNDLTALSRKTTVEIFALWGRSDIVLTNYTQTENQKGRLKTRTATTVTIAGDLQYGAKLDKQWIDLGMAKLGDGILYTSNDVTINPEAQITVDGTTWDMTKQVEGETISGNLDYQAWIATRVEES